jgi:DNA-binding GntR family transcriptional regulator
VSSQSRPSRRPVSEQAYAAIKRRILDLDFEPGQLLSELRLSQDFGLSRTPVREALKRLESEGLVDVVPQQGNFVAPIRLERVMDAQFARTALECKLAKVAAARRTAAALRGLERNLAQQTKAVAAGDFNKLYELDEAFHRAIAEAAGRPGVWELIADIKVHMDRARKLTLKPAHAPVIVTQHRAVVDALRAADADAASAAMDAHLSFVVEHFDDVLATNPAYGRELRKQIF